MKIMSRRNGGDLVNNESAGNEMSRGTETEKHLARFLAIRWSVSLLVDQQSLEKLIEMCLSNIMRMDL